MIYIATFFSHYGAVTYQKQCEKEGIASCLAPVPRTLSSSCGTCVRCEERWVMPTGESLEDVEKIVRETENGYEIEWEPD